MQDDLFSIGEMAEICDVSKRTMRYYDSIGLVKPSYTNEENGYRFYEPYQVGRIYLVKQMQELGISLHDVATCVREKGDEVNIQEFFSHIEVRKNEIEQELKNLRKQQKLIRDYITQYDDVKELLEANEHEMEIKYYPSRHLICRKFEGKLDRKMFGRTFAEIGSAFQNPLSEYHHLMPQIGSFYVGERNTQTCRNFIGFFSEQEKLASFERVEIEAGYYAQYRYRGEYNALDQQYEILRKYLQSMNYATKDYCVEIYNVSPGIHLNEKEYITQLQIPVEFQKSTRK